MSTKKNKPLTVKQVAKKFRNLIEGYGLVVELYPEDAWTEGEWIRLQAQMDKYGDLPVPKIKNLDKQVFDQITAPGNRLVMQKWHTCKTAHCRAGWAIVLAGKEGKELEKRFGSEAAGVLIYANSTGHVPDFSATNDDAFCDIARDAKVLR